MGAGDLLGLRAPGQLVQAQLATRQLVTLGRCHGANLNLNKKEYFRLSLSYEVESELKSRDRKKCMKTSFCQIDGQ